MTSAGINSTTTFAQSGVGLDAEGQLALLVLESEQSHEEAGRADKTVARQQFLDASAKEVMALRDEAHDILVGALVQGAVTVTAASIQFGDALDEPGCVDKLGNPMEPAKEKPWGEISAAFFNGSSQPLGKALGDSPAANDRADGKRAATAAQQAEWKLDDAQQAIDKSNSRQDKTLDFLQSDSANRASTETGIIAGFA
jgi:hypothetical protein